MFTIVHGELFLGKGLDKMIEDDDYTMVELLSYQLSTMPAKEAKQTLVDAFTEEAKNSKYIEFVTNEQVYDNFGDDYYKEAPHRINLINERFVVRNDEVLTIKEYLELLINVESIGVDEKHFSLRDLMIAEFEHNQEINYQFCYLIHTKS